MAAFLTHWRRMIAILMKAIAIAGLMTLSVHWILFFVPWGLAPHRAQLGWATWPYVACHLLGIIGVCVLIACLNQQNWRRILGQALLTILGAIVGATISDPMNRGSYDHGGGETLQGYLFDGIAGAVVAFFFWCLWRIPCKPNRIHTESEQQE